MVFYKKERCDCMIANSQKSDNREDASKLELYRLIGEGYLAIQEGRIHSIDEVKKNLEKRRELIV